MQMGGSLVCETVCDVNFESIFLQSLEESRATHFSIHAWIIPRTEEPGALWSIASQSHT